MSPEDDSDYAGLARCCLCGDARVHCFRLGIGADFLVACPACGASNCLDVGKRADGECRACHAPVPYPPGAATAKEPKACYACLRAGKAVLTKDTEFGMVSCEQLRTGVTNGVPGLSQDQFESVVLDPEEMWVGVRLPEEILHELLRTPTYGSWQGECWLFCCRYPMTFVGEWHQDAFNRHAADGNGEQLFYAVVEDVPPDTWDGLGHSLSAYVFECKRCGKRRAHYDSD